MQHETALKFSWMNILTKKRYDALRSVYGTLDTALDAVSLELLQQLGCKESSGMLAINRLEELDVQSYSQELKKRNLTIVSLEDASYPSTLLDLPDPPVFLYARGDLAILNQPCIALVGTREMSEYGRRVVATLVQPLVHAGMVTVSGLAYGIDAEVAQETLRTGGRTVAVLGHGLGMVYPKANEKLADAIIEKGGVLLSEFPLDIKPDPYTFPARNRLIAGLTLGTVVLEAAKKSGSLITAALALEYGKEVFAVPGHIYDEHYEGCHEIISRANAKLITSAQDILQEIGIVASSRAQSDISFIPDSPEEKSIFGALTSMPQSIDDLLALLQLEASTLSAVLTILELKGVAKNIGAGKWVRA